MTTERGVLQNGNMPVALGVLLTIVIAATVVLPPQYMAVYIMAGGAVAGCAALLRYRPALQNRWFPAIFGAYLTAAAFCFMGTLPIYQKSDIDLEFLKYGIYAAGFLIGFVVLRDNRKNRQFAAAVMALIFILFAMFAVKGGAQFHVDQSWPLYTPDQNNSATIILVLAVGIVATVPVYSRMLMLFALAVFVAFIESRAGLIIVGAMLLFQFKLAPKPAILALLASVGVWAYMSHGPVNPQTKLIMLMQNAVNAVANTTTSDQPDVPMMTPEQLPANRPLLEVGSNSDVSRIGIYTRALALSADVFPNLIGLGDAGVVERLNSPPITRNVVFQHAHNFLLQSYLAYGLLATIALVAAVVGMAVLAITRRAWSLLASLTLLAALGMMESLTSDIRVLTILSIFLGSHVAMILAGLRDIKTTQSELVAAN